MLTLVETTTLVANQCGCKKQKTGTYEVFGETSLCTDARNGKLIVPVKPVVEQKSPYSLPTVIIVRCTACDRKTFHRVDSYLKWMTVAPEGWRKHVSFDWAKVDGLRTLRNIRFISYDWRRETEQFGFVHTPNGEVIDRQYGYLIDIMAAYLDDHFVSKSCFRARWKDSVSNRLVLYHVEAQCYEERIQNLQLALEQSIVQLWDLRHMSKSPKLEGIRKGLEEALVVSNVPYDIRVRLMTLYRSTSGEAPFEAAAGS